jgi:hypothetical protein
VKFGELANLGIFAMDAYSYAMLALTAFGMIWA